MALKYFCNTCGNEIGPTSKVNPRPIISMTILDPRSPAPPAEEHMCVDCSSSFFTYQSDKQKELGVVPINKDLNIKIK